MLHENMSHCSWESSHIFAHEFLGKNIFTSFISIGNWFVLINIHFFLIGKKDNIIEKGIAGKIHRFHDSEQRVL